MCIIVYKPTGTENPSWETLHNCFNNNSDGAGFMYAENNRVYFEKGFMSWKSFKRAFKPFKNRTDLPIVIHFRITTHGGTEKGLCHPFPLVSDKKKLKATSGTTNVGIAHNGCISLTSNAEEGMSDTSEFVRKYASVVITNSKWYKNPNANKLLAEIIGSRMCVLSNDGHGELVGSGWSEVDGVMFSNTSYEKQTWVYYNSIFGDDWDDGYWHEYTDKSVSKGGSKSDYYDCNPTYCKHWFEADGKTERTKAAKVCDNCTDREWCWGY